MDKLEAYYNVKKKTKDMIPKLSDEEYSDKIKYIETVLNAAGEKLTRKNLDVFQMGVFSSIGFTSEDKDLINGVDIVEIMKPSMKLLIAAERYIVEHNL